MKTDQMPLWRTPTIENTAKCLSHAPPRGLTPQAAVPESVSWNPLGQKSTHCPNLLAGDPALR
jgi:hypothetical protein